MRVLLTLGVCIFAVGGTEQSPDTAERDQGAGTPCQFRVHGVPNVLRLHSRVLSGGSPDGVAGFRELARLGVRTVISVDGLQPDVRSARACGLQYVHLPHGYDGIATARVLELAKAVYEMPGAIYIHCHHGKHRSPVAAVSACVTLGYLSPESVSVALRLAGTSRRYAGLYRTAHAAGRVPLSRIQAVRIEFRDSVEGSAVIEAMAGFETIVERLEAHERRGWRPSGGDADEQPDHDALLLEELVTELHRDPTITQRGREFRGLLEESLTLSRQLRHALRSTEPDVEAATASLRSIRDNCVRCHRRFRD